MGRACPRPIPGCQPRIGAVPVSIDKLNVLRAAVFMSVDSILTDLRSIRAARSIEEAQALVNLVIDRVNALSKAAEAAGKEDLP